MNIDRVVLTDTAKSKCHRYLSERELKNTVKEKFNNNEAESISNDEYRINTSTSKRYLDNDQKLVVVFSVDQRDGDTVAIVITQKSKSHAN